MYQYVSEPKPKFNIMDACNDIAGAAFAFLADGKLYIWIYLIDGELKFFRCEFKHLSNSLVGHYKCHQITQGFSDADWRKLGHSLAKVYLTNKS